jgi:hypothetical protein
MLISVVIVAGLGRPVLPWTIIEVQDGEKKFGELFVALQAGVFDCVTVTSEMKEATLHLTYVGKSIEQLMVTSSTQSVLAVCHQFGMYVKFLVHTITPSVCAESVTSRSAFEVMRNAQRQRLMADDGLPFPVAVKDGRDRLFNDLICLMREMNVKWVDPVTYGVPFLKKVRDLLWYIDGHHDTIGERCVKIPNVFSNFNHYNCPEKYKHRKRTKGNLCSSVLSAHVAAVHDCLQSSWMKKAQFKGLYDVTEELVATLNAYISFLLEKAKYQKMHHEMRSVSPNDSSCTEFIPKVQKFSNVLCSLNKAVAEKEPYVPIVVNDFAPIDRKQRYR